MEVLRPCRHLQDQNIESYNLFGGMKLGGNLPPGHDALLFSISGTGSFICLVTDTRLDLTKTFIYPVMDQGGGGYSAPAQGS